MGRLIREAKGEFNFQKGIIRLYDFGISCYRTELDHQILFSFEYYAPYVYDLRIEGLVGKHLKILTKLGDSVLKVPKEELENWKHDINDAIIRQRGGTIPYG